MKKIKSLLRLMRPEQWAKNVFLFAPLIFSKHLLNFSYLSKEIQAFVAFSLVSSFVYCINDVADRNADKLHPVKKNRPVASGAVGVGEALVLAGVLLLLAAFIATPLGKGFVVCILIYLFLNIWYSFSLKRVVLVDVFVVASGYMLRILAGAYAINVEISQWLILCTLFISLFLAISKRRGELLLNSEQTYQSGRSVLKLYDVNFLDQLLTIVAAGTVISYALYTVAERTIKVFGTENLIFTTVFVLFGIFRYIFLLHTRKTEDNPTRLILSDIPLLVNIAAWFIVCIVIIYFNDILLWIKQ
ncbi:MAG: decaprenyl-phosphate phosphoribosyltransferase [Bacteroidetes bacterium]|nr:decaprenyl-phosphate phosphoribosyltransferase [Bacteroidota bacterium]